MRNNQFVYVAGPYSGKTHDHQSYNEIDANIAQAREAAKFLAENGVPFYCPHTNAAHFEVIAPDLPIEYWYKMDNVFVDLSSAVFLVEGWQVSLGTQAEMRRARQSGKRIFYPDEGRSLVDWWNKE